MRTLLDLPQSIRNRIHCHLLFSSLEPALSLSEFHDKEVFQRTFRHGHSLTEVDIERRICYPTRINLPFAGILRVNRQLRREMKETISYHASKKVDCSLDMMVECEDRVYPTWLKCPSRSPTVHRLQIDVRLLGYAQDLELADRHQARRRNRDRSLAFAIVAILARFVERGARFEHAKGEIDIHTVILNFESRQGGEKQLELAPIVNVVSKEDWDEDSLVSGGDEMDGGGGGLYTSDVADAVDGPDLLRTVDLVLKPLYREPRDLLACRRLHFSAKHIELIRRHTRRIFLCLDGRMERRIYIKMGITD